MVKKWRRQRKCTAVARRQGFADWTHFGGYTVFSHQYTYTLHSAGIGDVGTLPLRNDPSPTPYSLGENQNRCIGWRVGDTLSLCKLESGVRFIAGTARSVEHRVGLRLVRKSTIDLFLGTATCRLRFRWCLSVTSIMMKTISAILSLATLVNGDGIISQPLGAQLNIGNIQADSELARNLLSQARRVAQDDGGDDAFDANWVAGYSLKFQGCHHISQWNDNIESEEDVRIATKRLVRFRLCPSDSCSKTSGTGCGDGYGDYVVDMNTYLSYYVAARATYQQYECSYLTNYVCGCNGDNSCLYKCFTQHNMASVCASNNNGDTDDATISMEDYMTCTQSAFADENGSYLYIGPYCASQGGEIHLGAFTDDACTNFADNSAMGAQAFKKIAGYSLPYASANVIDLDCISCKEPANKNNDGNDANDADDVAEVCEAVYTAAGKCEANLPSGTVQTANNNACNYMEGIKIVRKDGTIVTANSKADKTAGAFIGLFTSAFILLSAYTYYLKLRLDRASINLDE
ncbi:hypothetical protein MPSEU_000985800 [Mayamaea pseudoterrestris]|nr:hypothetical protein MPSEU_000985800 [Mayamaea pseudoterrestris]